MARRPQTRRVGIAKLYLLQFYSPHLSGFDCGPCQQKALEEKWKIKLETAELFLSKLKEKDFPGVREVSALVEQLRDEMTDAMWSTRMLFPHAHKARVGRLSLGYFEKRGSPLRYELLPDDIPDDPVAFDYSDPGHEYNYSYIASTDPLHPVDANYTDLMDDADTSWASEHLTAEELAGASDDAGFDEAQADIAWEGNTGENTGTDIPGAGEQTSSDAKLDKFEADTRAKPDSWTWNGDIGPGPPETPELPPRPSPASQTHPTPATSPTNPSAEESQEAATHIELIIHEFWRTVNSNAASSPPPQPTTLASELPAQLSSLHISALPHSQTTQQSSQPPQPSPTPLHFLTDGSYSPPPASSPSTPSDTKLADATPPTPMQAHYAHHRARLNATKRTAGDNTAFYAEWLCLSRCEIRDVEGPEGRAVPDPGC
ncbi:hypothetical protein E8E13_002063 [Curvularia kusanoi]|uniref:Uncharacterized protein n=1 Tax=Curvularia kusanoi TaxID=90978 RepID=A0A9P4W4H1_CURKU|nr:hypothetical protein E8E13_002063 [Curvularia kusanoi]